MSITANKRCKNIKCCHVLFRKGIYYYKCYNCGMEFIERKQGKTFYQAMLEWRKKAKKLESIQKRLNL